VFLELLALQRTRRWRASCSMISMSTSLRRPLGAIAALIVTMAGPIERASAQDLASPRLAEGSVKADMPRAFGGGEVVLELAVDSEGAVAAVGRIRMTPPYLDFLVRAVSPWRFTPATALINGRVTPVAGSVLVVAVFRPPSVYADPAPGPRAQVLGTPSHRVPVIVSLTLPAYPPTATGDGVVVVEIEMCRGHPKTFRVVGAASEFDDAALDAVRSWRLSAPEGSDVQEQIFAYAVVGFRALLTLPAERLSR
jgi:hypothetical protein